MGHTLIGKGFMEIETPQDGIIYIYTNSFHVHTFSAKLRALCIKYIDRWVLRNRRARKDEDDALAVYGCRSYEDRVFALAIGQYEEFVECLRYRHYDRSTIRVIRKNPIEYEEVEFIKKTPKELWDKQIDAKEFIMNDNQPIASRLIAMPTGTGKTLTSVLTALEISNKFVVKVLPRFLDKWIMDLNEIIELSETDLMVIRKSEHMKSLTMMVYNQEPIEAKVFLVSLDTEMSYIDAYLENPNTLEYQGYYCRPIDLYPKLNIGTAIYDESHMHLNKVYKSICFTDVRKLIALSATMVSLDYEVLRIQKMMFPAQARYTKIKMKKYIQIYSLVYQFKDYRNRRIQMNERGSSDYSHNAFESSLLKSNRNLQPYLELIEYMVEQDYKLKYIKGDRALIYAHRVDMLDAIVAHLKKKFPEYDIRRYSKGEKDPYENAIDADIRVSTIGSLGAAIDIPNLVAVYNTKNEQSIASNQQAYGRLRELKDRDTRYWMISCSDIQKHMKYLKDREEMLRDRCLGFKELRYYKYL